MGYSNVEQMQEASVMSLPGVPFGPMLDQIITSHLKMTQASGWKIAQKSFWCNISQALEMITCYGCGWQIDKILVMHLHVCTYLRSCKLGQQEEQLKFCWLHRVPEGLVRIGRFPASMGEKNKTKSKHIPVSNPRSCSKKLENQMTLHAAG